MLKNVQLYGVVFFFHDLVAYELGSWQYKHWNSVKSSNYNNLFKIALSICRKNTSVNTPQSYECGIFVAPLEPNFQLQKAFLWKHDECGGKKFERIK